MTAFIRQRPILSAVFALFVLIVLLSSFPTIPETKQAVVVRFGKPERILNRYEAARPIGSTGAGLSYRIPFVDQIVWIDKRVLAVDMTDKVIQSAVRAASSSVGRQLGNQLLRGILGGLMRGR